MQPEILIAICVAVVIVFALLMGILSRYRKCPSDKILVIYGKVGSDKNGQARSAKCVHGGAAFIMPIIQSYQFMDLTPISINVDLKNALSKQNIRVDVPSRFTVGISTEPGIMQNAAERLLGLRMNEIQELDKVTVWDGGSKGENGKTATADFISGIMKAVPPMGEMFNQAGMELPKFLGEKIDDPKTLDS
jgi:conserved hypothetical protein